MATSLGQSDLVQKTMASVAEYMKPYDASHDYRHIEQVLSNALHIYEVESATHPEVSYDKVKVMLAALIHDVGDHKYPKPGQTPEDEKIARQTMLIRNGADPLLAEEVQKIASAVSYTKECSHPEVMNQVLREHLELGIVQDADRLDTLGPRGLARIFTYNGANPVPRGTMESALANNLKKLVRLPGMMKTEEGRRQAISGLEFVKDFIKKWDLAVDILGDGKHKYDWDSGRYV